MHEDAQMQYIMTDFLEAAPAQGSPVSGKC
jgi:hypothetical protein